MIETGTPVFMATTNWRGSMHVDTMRAFPSAQEAYDYAYAAASNVCGHAKAYALYSDKPPVNLMIKSGQKQFSITVK